MKPKTKIIKNKDLTRSQKNIINKARMDEWGKDAKKDFIPDYINS